MKTVNLFIAAISCLMMGASPSLSSSPQKPTKQCINSLPDDSVSFGFSVVVNDKYLAVGDLGGNRVIIYQNDNSGNWVRSQEILPPKDSIPEKLGSGFGRDLQLDGDVLVIDAYTYQNTKDVTNPEDFQVKTPLTSIFYGRYLIRLHSETEVKTIDLPMERTNGLVQLNLLSDGEIKQVTLPNNEEVEFNQSSGFGYNVEFDNNFLLVGSPSYPTKSVAWLFDLNQPETKPLKLSVPNALIGSSIALNERFAVVGNALFGEQVASDMPLKTVIRAIDSGATTVIDSYGELSLSGNILAVMRFGSFDKERTDLLEVFRLDDHAKPYLIIKREHRIQRAWVQNGFLVTVAPHFDINVRPINHMKVCLEPVH